MDATMFLNEKNSGNGVKISRFVNQSKINKPEFGLYWIWLNILKIISQIYGYYYLRNLPPMDFLYSDCTKNHTVKKYNSSRVNFWQKGFALQQGISRIILWKLLFFANRIVRYQKL